MSIELVIGPMFSGKTTELLRRIRRYTCTNKRCVVVKYSKDTRYSANECATHDRQMHVAISCGELLDSVMAELAPYDVVGLDEGQFFHDLVTVAEALANAGKIVIVAALDGTFQRKPFGSVLELIPMAEHVQKLSAVCQVCYHDAAFSKRLGNETAVEVIGGADLYVAVCRRCYHSNSRPGSPAPSSSAGSSPAATHSMPSTPTKQVMSRSPVTSSPLSSPIVEASAVEEVLIGYS